MDFGVAGWESRLSMRGACEYDGMQDYGQDQRRCIRSSARETIGVSSLDERPRSRRPAVLQVEAILSALACRANGGALSACAYPTCRCIVR